MKLIVFALTFLFIFSQVPISSSLNTGPFNYDTGLVNIPYNIEIKFWGFDELLSEIGTNLSQRLPRELFHESYNPTHDITSNHFIPVADTFYGLKSTMSYQLTKMDEISNATGFLVDSLQYYQTTIGNPVAVQRYFDENNTNIQISGLAIDQKDFTRTLSTFNNERGYTIHLINLTIADKASFNAPGQHWYRAGEVNNLPRHHDMRNMGYVGSNGVFYDPTAIAPVFENVNFNSTLQNRTASLDYLYERLIKIIESVIVGSPFSFNYISMEEKIEIAQVFVGNNSFADGASDLADFNIASSILNSNDVLGRGLFTTIPDLLPYLNTSFKSIKIDLSLISNVLMNNFLVDNEVSNETGTYLNLTSALTEEMKNIIRRNYYEKWPTRFFYILFIFVDSKSREFIFDDTTGSQAIYENKEIGVGIVNLKDWRLLSNTNKQYYDIQKEINRVFGKLFGLAELNDKFISQIISSMSSYGLPVDWNSKYSSFEVQNLAKRYAAPFNITTKLSIRSYRKDLESSYFKWIDSSPLDEAEKLRIEANTAYRQENYTKAAKIYIAAYLKWLDAQIEIDAVIIKIYNSINFVGGIIIFVYVITFIRSLTLSKDEYYKIYNPTDSK